MTTLNIPQINPATGETIGEIQICSASDVQEAFFKAKAAQAQWQALGYKARASYLLRIRQIILGRLEEIAACISENNGKPRIEAISADILPICDLITYYSKKTEKFLKPKKIGLGMFNLLGRSSQIVYEPLGVIGIISPWNFPFSIPLSETLMALQAGNCVLLKSSELTGNVGKIIASIFEEARLPRGVFTHLSGDASTGQALTRLNLDKIVFTGSVAVGKRIMNLASEKLTPLTLELGGKDAMIVLKDAHLNNAAQAAVWGAFTNCGQVCASVERVYVAAEIFEKFKQKVTELTQTLTQGDASKGFYDLGPLSSHRQRAVIETQIQDLKEKSGRILCGGETSTNSGFFYPPTVMEEVNENFKCVSEESFGPLLPLIPFDEEEEAIKLANQSDYALTASVWSQDLKRANQIALKLQAGSVLINECTYSYALSQTPWGGFKLSGFGKTHGKEGLLELVHAKHIHTNHLPWIKNFWWFPYDEALYESFKKLCYYFSGSSFDKLKALMLILKETIRSYRRKPKSS